MKCAKEIIAALRSTPSRSKRELFDTAADMIEAAMDKPVVSRADWIRAMSDEELAERIYARSAYTLCEIICGGKCKAIDTLDKTSDQVCKEIVLKWLKQPADHAEVASEVLMRPNGEEDA